MPLPVIAKKVPAILDLEPGTYTWCACGTSDAQPFCDGSHACTSHAPMAFEVKEKRKVALCLCKRTSNPPYCDGKHIAY